MTTGEDDPGITAGLAPGALAIYRACESELAGRLTTLPDQPAETVATTLAALWHAASGQPMSVQRASRVALPALDEEGCARLRDLLRRRLEGSPVAHLAGRQEFMGLELIATPDALIPRDETQLLGRAALERVRAAVQERGAAMVIDACTGSGNLALALAWHEPRARVWGADLSGEAVALARRNALHTGLADRVSFRAGDLLAPFETPEFGGRVDVLVCNPPYISSGKVDALPAEIGAHEPRLAFDGGPFGIRILQRLVNEAPRLLREGGTLAFEVGLGQGPGIRRRLEQNKRYADIAEVLDANGQARVLMARLAAIGAPAKAR
jgi:release factor glutamine methyltransferase